MILVMDAKKEEQETAIKLMTVMPKNNTKVVIAERR